MSGSEEEDEVPENDEEEDAPQVAANESAGNKYPLAHRCLSASEFTQVDQLESALTPSHECVMLMQRGTGVDPGTSTLLAAAATKLAEGAKLTLVTGSEGHESTREIHESALHPMFRIYRKEFALQMRSRFGLSSHPGNHVLLC